MKEYNKNIVPLAKKLRKAMTDEERKLWYSFLRDYPPRRGRHLLPGPQSQPAARFGCINTPVCLLRLRQLTPHPPRCARHLPLKGKAYGALGERREKAFRVRGKALTRKNADISALFLLCTRPLEWNAKQSLAAAVSRFFVHRLYLDCVNNKKPSLECAGSRINGFPLRASIKQACLRHVFSQSGEQAVPAN